MATKNTSKRFAPKLQIRKGDRVMVIAGDDKGKVGEVIEVIPSRNRAVVEGVNIVKKHLKATQYEAGGITDMPASIHISNLSLVDPKSINAAVQLFHCDAGATLAEDLYQPGYW